MPYNFVVFPTPLDSQVTLTPDGGAQLTGATYTDPTGRAGQVCTVPDVTTSGHGAEINVSAPGYLPLRLRGFLLLDADSQVARLEVDDYVLTEEPEVPAPPDPTPPGNQTAEQIINDVFNTTHPNLATKDGCGKFTEDCCTALHEQHSQAWGHIHKFDGQNQYNGHAVDALMLLGNTADAQAGVYDIIFSSASPEATPAFNWSGPPDYSLWYYPADAVTRGGPMPMRFEIPRLPRPRG